MKTQVFVLLPADAPLDDLRIYFHQFLKPHCLDQSSDSEDEQLSRNWRFDYLCGVDEGVLHDPAALQRLPAELRSGYEGCFGERANLPDHLPGGLVTPDGTWHDLFDFGWKLMNPPAKNEAALKRWEDRYRELIAKFDSGWVVEICAHS